jgi:plasmid replication initiation protein
MDKIEKSKFVIQTNVITTARYEYSVIEKRIVYHIIKHIQSNMGTESTLFGDPYVRIPMKELVTNDHYGQVKLASKSLRQKSFEINYKNEDWVETGLINWSKFTKEDGMMTYELSKMIIPVLLEVANNFTLYDLNVALSLRSPYSQRIYEFCCQFRESGILRISIQDFKERLKIEDTPAYNGKVGNGNLKSRILEKARIELEALYKKGDCDLFFVYEFKKNDGKIFTDIEVKIFSKKNPKHVPQMEDDRAYCINFIKGLFREEREIPYVRHISQELFNKQAYNLFALKIDSFKRKYSDAPESDRKRILRTILEQDFKIANIK